MNNFRITPLIFAFLASFPSIGATNCQFNGRPYTPGRQIPGSCVLLNCNDTTGQWDYSGPFNPDHCCYPCLVRDDPHCSTFDECGFQNHDACKFSLTQTGTSKRPFTGIFNTHVKCGNRFPGRTCLGELYFKAFRGCKVKFDPSNWNEVQVNGVTKTLTPFPTEICFAKSGFWSYSKRSVLAWRDPNDDCVIVMGHRGLLARFCVLGHRKPSLHYLEIWTPQIYDDDLFGICNKFLSMDGKLVARDRKEIDCGNHPKYFIHSWAVDPTCPAHSRSLKKMDDKCPDKIHQDMTKRCEKALEKVPLDEKKKRMQTDFCVADACAMKRGNTLDHDIDEYIQTTRDTLMKFGINPAGRKHGNCGINTTEGNKSRENCRHGWNETDPDDDPDDDDVDDAQ